MSEDDTIDNLMYRILNKTNVSFKIKALLRNRVSIHAKALLI